MKVVFANPRPGQAVFPFPQSKTITMPTIAASAVATITSTIKAVKSLNVVVMEYIEESKVEVRSNPKSAPIFNPSTTVDAPDPF